MTGAAANQVAQAEHGPGPPNLPSLRIPLGAALSPIHHPLVPFPLFLRRFRTCRNSNETLPPYGAR